MSQLAIYLPDDRSDFEPMETISVEAQWELDSEPDSLQLRVVWNTSGKGDTNISTKKIITIDSPGAADSRRLDVELPAEPYSFSGKYVSLIWALELIAQPLNESCRREITIGPGRREVLLHRESTDPPAEE
ncbi:MAG: hypothetical protein FJ302_13160 [Planctomycetes bacterium]|nr:hypothetical protein [Planctomycetota bacterium]